MIKKILLYGVVLGLVGLGLKLAEYRLIMVDHAVELYAGVVAIVFAVAGMLTARKFIKPKEVIVEVPVQVPVPVPVQVAVQVDAKKLDELGISKRVPDIGTNSPRTEQRGNSRQNVPFGAYYQDTHIKYFY